jgi:cell filamentation protein
MSDDPYTYPGTTILRNKLGIRDAGQLEALERRMAAQRAAEGIPAGDFGLPHLQAIHYHLFQDVYDWAGQVRTVELNKGGDQFMFRRYIQSGMADSQSGMADIHHRIAKADYFSGLSQTDFAVGAGEIMGDINYVHPFREGNGRTQLLYLKQLSIAAGHRLELRHIDPNAWIEASKMPITRTTHPWARRFVPLFNVVQTETNSAPLHQATLRAARSIRAGRVADPRISCRGRSRGGRAGS